MYGGNSKINKKISFILACAGIGKRMKLDYPKQFLEYEGKPLF
ncbi:MAG: 2-C-methyl-D-erythritol 4-phosphate cytidylyltransferase, partial [Fusobacteriales bacterium]